MRLAIFDTGGQVQFRLMRTELHNPRDLLARNLRVILNAQDRSARDVAKKCGLSNKTVSNMLNSAHSVTMDNVSCVASELGVPLWQLLSPEMPGDLLARRDIPHLINHYMSATPDGQARIMRTALLESRDAAAQRVA